MTPRAHALVASTAHVRDQSVAGCVVQHLADEGAEPAPVVVLCAEELWIGTLGRFTGIWR